MIITPSGIVYCGSSPDPPLIQLFTKVNDTVSKLTKSRTIQYGKWKKYNTNTNYIYYWRKYNIEVTTEEQHDTISEINFEADEYLVNVPNTIPYYFDNNTSSRTYYATSKPSIINGKYKASTYDYIEPEFNMRKNSVYLFSMPINVSNVYQNNNGYNTVYVNLNSSESESSTVYYVYGVKTGDNTGITYIESYSIIEIESIGETNYGSVSSSYRNQYPDNGSKNGYWYVYDRNETTYSQGTYIEDVYDIDSSKYPTNGKHTDGYWYVKVA